MSEFGTVPNWCDKFASIASNISYDRWIYYDVGSIRTSAMSKIFSNHSTKNQKASDIYTSVFKELKIVNFRVRQQL